LFDFTGAKMVDQAEKEVTKKTAGKHNKREKFVELAESRTRNAIRAIRIIAKLGNKSAYDYSEADVKKIASALNREVEALRARMSQTGGKDAIDFEL
jgi:ribosomal protein L7/L12